MASASSQKPQHPRLQRTRFAPLRAPLSRQPLGVHSKSFWCAILVAAHVIGVGGCSTTKLPGTAPRRAAPPALAQAAAGEPTPSGALVGTYQHCEPDTGCWSLTLFADQTFWLDRVVRVIGTWKLLEPDVILANSNDQPTAVPLQMSERAPTKQLKVRVQDATSRVALCDAVVGIQCEGLAASVPSDDAGVSEFQRCAVLRLEVTKPGYVTAVYENVPASFNQLDVSLRWASPYLTNQLWIVRNGELFLVDTGPLTRREDANAK
ncbi:MAG: hypothetical protein ACRDHG_09385 [Anaerolineales bacterium]